MSTILKFKRSAVPNKVPLPADLEFGEIAINYQDGIIYYKKSDGTIAAIGGGGIQYTRKTANYTALDKDGIIADTTAGSFTITLPASPTVGSQVVIVDGNNWGTNNLTVGRNGSSIKNLTENLILDIAGISVQFIYDGTTWEVFAQAGVLTANPLTIGAIIQNETSVLTNQTILAGYNGQSVGPITVNTGIAVTVATGQVWLVY
jgi:hypothetical protein